MNKKQKANQCQDCGCPGSQIREIEVDSTPIESKDLLPNGTKLTMKVMECPMCKRKGVPYFTDSTSTNKPEPVAIYSWNLVNRPNKEGLG